jgi:cell wall-associated NlpC family hydrolase
MQRGDLVFFTSPGSGRNVGHVGIVVDVDPMTHTFSFIHASSSGGVKISQSNEGFYSSRYIGVRRVVE